MKIYLLMLMFFQVVYAAVAQQSMPVEKTIAFPGAEGGGRYASGGRGGRVIFVTSLEDNHAPGTLRHAVEQRGSRTIIFKLSGTIFLKSPLNISEGYLTIAGQSAPGEGICIAHQPVTVSADQVIIRYLRFRMGDVQQEGADGGDAFSGRKNKEVIIDHCSISWSTDECSSFYDNENFTMQWCIISESLRLSGHSKGPHGYGAIWGGVNASYHHNLLAHHDSRTPRMGPGDKFAGKDRTDVRNNVCYNWNGNGCYGAEAMHINMVNNYFKAGPATSKRIANRIIAISAKDGRNGFHQIKGIWGRYYITGNFFPGYPALSADNQLGIEIEGKPGDHILLKEPVMADMPQTFSAQEAYQQVLKTAGCSKHRDEVDRRIIEEVSTGTAAYKGLSPYNGEGKSAAYPRPGIIDSQMDLRPGHAPADWSPWPELKSAPAAADTDLDGMPDAWEITHKLDPKKANAVGRELAHGYDNLEVYLNSL